MCLILFALDVHEPYPLIIAANRDESYARPSARAMFWDDHPDVLAGRDLDQGGTWLGITRAGRWAAITNFRQGGAYRADAPSRGRLASDFLTGDLAPLEYLRSIEPRANAYNGFNLIAGDLASAWYLSNRAPGIQLIPPGVHGLSNHILDTPWNKVVSGRRRLASLPLGDPATLTEALLAHLSDRTPAPANLLPDTGIGINREKALSPAFIAADTYGTRASTVVLLSAQGNVHFCERAFGPRGEVHDEVRHHFTVIATESQRLASCKGG